MSLILNLFFLVCVGAVLLLGLNGVNILQAGSRKADGRTMRQILGVDPETATYDDIEKLPRSEKMQLFHAARLPKFEDINRGYRARLLSGGYRNPAPFVFEGPPREWVGPDP